MKSLPIHQILDAMLAQLARHQAVALHAPPGAGKSTVVPGALLESGLISEGLIVLLEPRRAAARSVARRIAQLMGEPLGQRVGYQVRFEGKRSAQTRILVITEGLLTRWLENDPFLEGVGAVIVDEFHERSVHVDLALAFLKEVMTVREDLKVVVMSATFDAQAVSTYLDDCPILKCDGRLYPVEVHYEGPRNRLQPLDEVVKTLSRLLKSGHMGDILTFLPGAPEIHRVKGALMPLAQRLEVDLTPLYGALPAPEQDKALKRGPRQKVILSTNLAETSLTIQGVTAVVDSGLRKVNRYDPRRGFERLETVMISRASATQRAGRAGRVGKGQVHRLWSEAEFRGMPEADKAQIHLVDLASVILNILSFSPGDIHAFDFFEAPSTGAIDAALAQLRRLDLIESAGWNLTPLGQVVAPLPLAPRLGILLYEGARRGMHEAGAMMAAILSEADILGPDLRQSPPSVDSDLLWRMGLLEDAQERGMAPAKLVQWGLRPPAVKQCLRAYRQLLSLSRSLAITDPAAAMDPLHLPLMAYADRLCMRKAESGIEGAMVGGQGVQLHRRSGVREHRLFLALELGGGYKEKRAFAQVQMASGVTVAALKSLMPERLRPVEGAEFDAKRGSVAGVSRLYFEDLSIAKHRGVKVEAHLLADALAEAAESQFQTLFKPNDRALALIHRLRLAAEVFPEAGYLDVSEAALKGLLPELCYGKRKLSDLSQVDWYSVLKNRMSYALFRQLEVDFPERLEIPSGRQVVIDYGAAFSPQKMPILAARIQEFFGWAKAPTLAQGRVRLLLHLLAPNYRPAQVTTDLENFWNETYHMVRKELRPRYPKHQWPDDPWGARFEGRIGGRRGRR